MARSLPAVPTGVPITMPPRHPRHGGPGVPPG
jgi:hypothetical protein